MKIAVIGGGSTYTPEIIDGMLQRAELFADSEIVLMDIDPQRLEVVGPFCQRMVEHYKSPLRVSTTLDRERALDGADFVLSQFRVGKQAARHQDILMGLRHELIGQETTGVGGMAKALRTLPVALSICEDMRRLCPEAWLINFTNPSGLITQALLDHGKVNSIGLCNVPTESLMLVAAVLQADPSEVHLDFVGLNHLGWIRKVLVRGEDHTDKLRAIFDTAEGPANIPDMAYDPWLIDSLGAFPMYYNRYYYYTDRILEQLKSKDKTRAQEVMLIEQELLEIYRDPAQHTKPAALENRGGAFYSKIAVDLIETITNDLGREHIVNVANAGAIPNLDEQAVVEISCKLNTSGAVPVATEPLQDALLALIAPAKAYERLTIEAHCERSRDKALLALTCNPLGPTASRAEDVLDDMIEVNGFDYLRGSDR
ncbi:MAG: 6-phospho-beta-glucosidase [Candidatus Alcyoniella australis]|nr:6-phospho-beta-glucosidase [Candidatus Alcyoniella australis]